jgi:hypothetical protein
MTKPMPSASLNWQGHCNRSHRDQLAIQRKLQCTENEKKTSEESAGRAYLVLWKWGEGERINGSVITRGEGSHSGGLKRGDRIFVCATKGDELYILGAMQIKRGGPDWAEGRQSIRGYALKVSRIQQGTSMNPKGKRTVKVALRLDTFKSVLPARLAGCGAGATKFPLGAISRAP